MEQIPLNHYGISHHGNVNITYGRDKIPVDKFKLVYFKVLYAQISLECEDSLYRFTEYSSKNTIKVYEYAALMEVKDSMWEKDTIPFLYGNNNADHHSGTGFFL
jgi:hypothetical protein